MERDVGMVMLHSCSFSQVWMNENYSNCADLTHKTAVRSWSNCGDPVWNTERNMKEIQYSRVQQRQLSHVQYTTQSNNSVALHAVACSLPKNLALQT